MTASVNGSVTGTVSFFSDGTKIGEVAVENGKAVLKISTLKKSLRRMITATYNGDANYKSATSDSVGLTILGGSS